MGADKQKTQLNDIDDSNLDKKIQKNVIVNTFFVLSLSYNLNFLLSYNC